MAYIKKYLASEVALMKLSSGGVPGRHLNGWASLSDFVLHHGRQWMPGQLPEGIKPGVPKECYRNAACLAMDNPNEYVYCEGYALSIIPVAHAWCIDFSGTVIDPTWTGIRNSVPPGREYFGIAFKFAYLRRALWKQRHYGLIDVWESGWPLLKTPEEKWKHPINEGVLV